MSIAYIVARDVVGGLEHPVDMSVCLEDGLTARASTSRAFEDPVLGIETGYHSAVISRSSSAAK